MRPLQEVLRLLPTNLETGLTAAGVAQSRRQFGGNRLTPLPREPIWKKFLEKFDEPIIKILLAAALLSMIVDLFQASGTLGGISLGLVVVAAVGTYAVRKAHWLPSLLFGLAIVIFFLGLFTGHTLVEGLAVMIAVILATGVAFASEYKSDREFELLNAQKEALRVKVTRDNQFHTIPMDDVVVGDIVILEMGDEIPADGRLVKATDLYVDQSLMTGESEPTPKKVRPPDETSDGPEQPGCLYRGTQVVDGVAQMLVTEVGDETYLGQIARRLSAAEVEQEEEAAEENEQQRIKHKLTISKELTPLQLKLQHLAELISKVGYAAAVLIFLALLIRGLFVGEIFWPTSLSGVLDVFRHLLQYFVYMVIIIVVAVPEGLPMSVTVSLALAMRKMTRANSLVRQLVACETIGSATVICSDKTGTLTQNKMQVVRLSWEGQVFDRNTPDWVKPEPHLPWPRDGKPIDWLALNAAVNSTANLEEKTGKLFTVGNSTEGALLQWLHEGGIEYQKLRLQFEPLYQIHFSSERKRMTTVVKVNGRLIVLAKGAPEWIIQHSTHYQAADGTTQPWTPEMKEAVQEKLRDSAAQAMRTLAFGYAVLPVETPEDEDGLHARRDSIEADLVYIGFVAIRDPLRDDVHEAVQRCREAGIEVKMITGDNVETARAIGYDIGLIDRRDAPIDTDDASVMTSAKFNELSDAELKQRLPALRIIARAKPLDKFRLVKLLQELGEVVAVTGDGTNDAPALKKADVGLSMGIAGTEVAKEASKIVLLDDAFSTIVKAVHWGRSLYENIQRFIQFQLTINVSALTIAFLGPFFGIRPPFTVLQLLWINVIMDTFAAIALCSEPPREGLMRMPPKKKDENIITPLMARTIFSTALFFIVVMMALLALMEYGGWFRDLGSGVLVDPDKRATSLTLYQATIFFTVYVFFQVWNQINCRSLVPEVSGFHRIWHNPTFLAIAGTVAIGQIVIVTIGGEVFQVEPLSFTTWVVIIIATTSVLVFAAIARRVQMRLRGGRHEEQALVPLPARSTA
ncbi:MAG: HAD-IC family P-type ATPase [Gemmataceae bacterium]